MLQEAIKKYGLDLIIEYGLGDKFYAVLRLCRYSYDYVVICRGESDTMYGAIASLEGNLAPLNLASHVEKYTKQAHP